MQRKKRGKGRHWLFFIWFPMTVYSVPSYLNEFLSSVPVMRDVSGWSYGEEMTPRLSSASLKSPGQVPTLIPRWVDGKTEDWNSNPRWVPTGCYQATLWSLKAGRWKEVMPSPRRDNLTSFFYPVKYLWLEVLQTQHMPSVCARSGGKTHLK